MKKMKLGSLAILTLISVASHAQSVTDIDGNSYRTVTIGTQTWMQENLNTTRFNNGIEIITTDLPVANDTTALFQWAYDDDTTYIAEYGRLYTWNVTQSTYNVCPVGWKVPDNTDWETLRDYLGGEFEAGGKMKEKGTTHWVATDSTVTNSCGFTSVANGNRGNPSGFTKLGEIATFWSSTPFGTIGTFPRGSAYVLFANNNNLQNSAAVAQNGKAIRCILDETAGMKEVSNPTSVLVYPNPASESIFIRVREMGKYHLTIHDMMGKRLYEQDIESTMDSVDISSLPQGTYVIKVISEQQIISYKFVKQ